MTHPTTKKSFGIYSQSFNGHRPSYIRFFKDSFNAREISKNEIFKYRHPVVFLMIDECFIFFVIVALIRFLVGRKTAGLLFNPFTSNNSFPCKTQLKLFILKVIKFFKISNVVSIMPHYLDQKLLKVSSSWIYDIQFFDLLVAEQLYFESLVSNQVTSVNNINLPKKVKTYVSTIGRQSDVKGLQDFINLYVSNKSIREKFIFVVAGEVWASEEIKALIPEFISRGGLVFDRYLTDDEIIFVYARSSYVWAAYSVDYDQSSGIFGRAVQLSVPAILRKGSKMSFLAEKLSADFVSFSEDGCPQFLETNLKTIKGAGSNRVSVEDMKSFSKSVLAKVVSF